MSDDVALELQGKTVQCDVCGEETALEEEYQGVTSWLCVSCGYTTNTTLKKNSKELLMSPMTIQKLKHWDKKRQLYWILTVINMPSRGILFPEEMGNQIIWTFAPMVDIPESEQKNYPIPNQAGYYTRRLDPDNAKKFTQFYDALQEMGAVIKMDKIDKKVEKDNAN